ncbi:MAG: adenosylcobinamide amidohydrolase [Kineosporiaceae bacterium]
MTSGPGVPSPPAPPGIRLLTRQEGRREQPVVVWAPGPGWRAISSALLGGGLGPRTWWLDAQVDNEYFHPDPVEHAREIARGLGLLPDAGVAMLTAADVRRWTGATDGGVRVVATVGLGLPVRAAVAEEVAAAEASTRVGTINLLVVVPVPLSDAALVNAVVTATEAKAQAMAEGGVPGTGTASDAICIACPGAAAAGAEPEPYGGPRSTWGARVARAVHAAVAAGTADWLAGGPGRG